MAVFAGNMTRDNNKGISIDYNYLNLPQQITFDSGDEMHYLYTAEGQKLQKRIVEQAGSTSKTEYFGGRIYESGQLKEIAHEEGRILATTTGFEYHYYLRDHLGNVLVEFKEDANGEAAITQENHYYPFGMRFSGEVFANNDNDFRYNGKELQDDFGLDWPRFQRDCLSLSIGFANPKRQGNTTTVPGSTTQRWVDGMQWIRWQIKLPDGRLTAMGLTTP